MKRTLVIAAVIVLALAAGALAYRQYRFRQAAPRGDPAVAVAVTIRALERSEKSRLSGDQVKAILPLLRVLRDTDPNDAEASRALAEQIRAQLTPEQLAALERMREEFRRRRESGEVRPGRPRSRAEARQRTLSRLIQRLEDRL